MSLNCPQCQQPLSLSDGELICNGCGARYPAQPCCPECHQPLEVLKACGAVNYFCGQGHGLISTKRVLLLPAGG
ncbi:zinc ribbon domain-containing protein [Pantoea sp. C2G6]|uniref:zinc ribbon domain-containing protein n=1 Tax=Pantoea sp. C2G6 TaxID=3243084 RepID=UPI003EDAE326